MDEGDIEEVKRKEVEYLFKVRFHHLFYSSVLMY